MAHQGVPQSCRRMCTCAFSIPIVVARIFEKKCFGRRMWSYSKTRSQLFHLNLIYWELKVWTDVASSDKKKVTLFPLSILVIFLENSAKNGHWSMTFSGPKPVSNEFLQMCHRYLFVLALWTSLQTFSVYGTSFFSGLSFSGQFLNEKKLCKLSRSLLERNDPHFL